MLGNGENCRMDDQEPHIQAEAIKEHSATLVGRIFENRFEVEACLGKGGAGAVYKCKDLLLSRTVALKLMHAELLDSPDKLDRFQREAQALNCLSHPFILSTYAFGVTADWQPYLVLPFLEGKSLQDAIESESPIGIKRCMAILLMICDALSHVHQEGIVHRDLKPGNIMLVSDESGNEIAQIVDFGISKPLSTSKIDAQKLTSTGEIFGSPFYMSPEQWRGLPVDTRSDIYSFGCLMYETLTGEVPLDAEELLSIMVENKKTPVRSLNLASKAEPPRFISEELEAVVLKAMEIDAENRYQSVESLKADLLQTPEAISSDNSDTRSIDLQKAKRREDKRVGKKPMNPGGIKILGVLSCALLLGGLYALPSIESTSDGQIFMLSWKTKAQSLFLNSNAPQLVRSKYALADQLYKTGKQDEAIKLYESIGSDPSSLALLKRDDVAFLNDRLAEARVLRKTNLESNKYSKQAVSQLDKLGAEEEKRGRYDLAVVYYRAALNNRRRTDSRDYYLEGHANFHLAQTYEKSKQSNYQRDAEGYYVEAIRCFKKSTNSDPRYTVLAHYNLSLLLLEQDRLDHLFDLYQDALIISQKAFAADDPVFLLVAAGMDKLGEKYRKANQPEKARLAFEASRNARNKAKARDRATPYENN